MKKKRLSPQERRILSRKITASAMISIMVTVIVLIFTNNVFKSGISFFASLVIMVVVMNLKTSLKEADRIKQIESVFPDFLQLVASNLRAGMTVDKAMLLSARPEFAPLDREIFQVGKDISTGKPIALALKSMSMRIKSENVTKTLLIVLSGIRAGGNLAVLLEETSTAMRQRGIIEKKAASQVLMYVIFIFLAVAIFAPGLFALSGVLVGTLNDMMGGISPDMIPSSLPISFSSISVSQDFVFYFSLVFIIVMNFMAALTLGLVSKGSEKEGLRYLPIMLILSLGIFFVLGRLLDGVIGGILG